MKSKTLRALTAVGLLVTFVPFSFAQQAGQTAGQVDAMVPNATRNAKPTQVKDKLQWRDLLKTDTSGRLRANLVDGSILTVGRDSEIRVLEHDPSAQRTALELNYGQIRSQVVKRTQPGGKFEVRTPHAVIGVIGTDFHTLVNAVMTRVICYKGLLSVLPGAPSAAAIQVAAGQMLEITSAGAGAPQPTPHETEQESMEETNIPHHVPHVAHKGGFPVVAAVVLGAIGVAAITLAATSGRPSGQSGFNLNPPPPPPTFTGPTASSAGRR